MKNFIISVLLIALAILSYLHFFKKPVEQPVINKNVRSLELGRDSLEIKFYYEVDSLSKDSYTTSNTSEKKELAYTFITQTDSVNCAPTDFDCFARIIGGGKPHNPPPPIIPADFQKFINYFKLKPFTISIRKLNSVAH